MPPVSSITDTKPVFSSRVAARFLAGGAAGRSLGPEPWGLGTQQRTADSVPAPPAPSLPWSQPHKATGWLVACGPRVALEGPAWSSEGGRTGCRRPRHPARRGSPVRGGRPAGGPRRGPCAREFPCVPLVGLEESDSHTSN